MYLCISGESCRKQLCCVCMALLSPGPHAVMTTVMQIVLRRCKHHKRAPYMTFVASGVCKVAVLQSTWSDVTPACLTGRGALRGEATSDIAIEVKLPKTFRDLQNHLTASI